VAIGYQGIVSIANTDAEPGGQAMRAIAIIMLWSTCRSALSISCHELGTTARIAHGGVADAMRDITSAHAVAGPRRGG
jgi:hypothetical protein